MSEAPERNENKTAPAAPKKRTPPEMKTLPMLPLRGMVVFPSMIIHLDVGSREGDDGGPPYPARLPD